MAQSNEERIRFANDEIFAKGNLDAVDEIFAARWREDRRGMDGLGTSRTVALKITCGIGGGDER